MSAATREHPTTDGGGTAVDVRSVAVVGAGVMGSGIAQSLAVSGFTTTCVDRDEDAVDRARGRVASGRHGLARAVRAGALSRDAAEAATRRLHLTTDLDAITGCDLVIESVPEDVSLKQQVLRAVAAVVNPHVVLATNTSGLTVDHLAEVLADPGRFVAWHWASPASRSPFAEIVRGARTSDRAVATVVAVARATGRDPVVVRENPDRWGFVANRVYTAMLAEAQAVVDEGLCTAPDVDRLLRDAYAFPSGPFEILHGAASGWE